MGIAKTSRGFVDSSIEIVWYCSALWECLCRDHVNDEDDDNDGILDIHDEDDDGDGILDTHDEDWHADL